MSIIEHVGIKYDASESTLSKMVDLSEIVKSQGYTAELNGKLADINGLVATKTGRIYVAMNICEAGWYAKLYNIQIKDGKLVPGSVIFPDSEDQEPEINGNTEIWDAFMWYHGWIREHAEHAADETERKQYTNRRASAMVIFDSEHYRDATEEDLEGYQYDKTTWQQRDPKEAEA